MREATARRRVGRVLVLVAIATAAADGTVAGQEPAPAELPQQTQPAQVPGNSVNADIIQFGPAVDYTQRRLVTIQMQTAVAKDPSATGVAAVVTARELLQRRGINAAVSFFEELLPSLTDPTVERAVRLQLMDLHKDGNQTEKALTHARALITRTGPEKR